MLGSWIHSLNWQKSYRNHNFAAAVHQKWRFKVLIIYTISWAISNLVFWPKLESLGLGGSQLQWYAQCSMSEHKSWNHWASVVPNCSDTHNAQWANTKEESLSQHQLSLWGLMLSSATRGGIKIVGTYRHDHSLESSWGALSDGIPIL
jgi:hypothetical protein